MTGHLEKRCPRCQGPFLCAPDAIDTCQCRGVELTAAQRDRLSTLYADCLCRKCLLEEAISGTGSRSE